ncbi:hypothetical protein SAY87_010839 [Trapa incisa]|uniref:Protein FAR1-RELATED SEQUENCE n=1 Tax=Trapa incisa TaxID=236973 RepID=A0AAN7GR20_9MYRT|nr:hypothetical protein SAY87_010839 [Trapa incisa]
MYSREDRYGNPLGRMEMLGEEEDGGDCSNTGVNNFGIGNSVHVSEEDGNSCPVEEQGIEAPVQLSAGFTAALENRMESNILWVDFHHDGAACEPQSGLEFETKEDAYSFYREYARSVGFGITIKASRRSKKSGNFIDVKIACSRFGIKRESDAALNPRFCPKTDCKAGMHIKRREDGMWVIHSFVKEHNHEICPDDFYQSIRGTSKQFGGATYLKKDLQLVLTEEDVQVMLENFINMQDEIPNFFYSIDFNHGKCLRNVLWIDPRAAYNYDKFCDVVFFDTFYVSNKYHIPFVPIVGVNNHCQYILLGSALVGNQTTSTYTWVMQTWLRAVGGKFPRVIITDQGKSLEEAVAKSFPEARHCFCLWHVLRKVPENLGYVIDKHEDFWKVFDECVNHSLTAEQFENEWEKLVVKFELGENDWVCSLYENRRKWVAAYMQDIFLAGLSTPLRSKSISTFFDKYIWKETTMKEFMEKFKLYLHESYKMEVDACAKSCGLQPTLKSFSSFEKQMSTVYTSTVFKQFQDEVLGIESCRLLGSEFDMGGRFQVEDLGEDKKFIVHWNENKLEICCLCRLFDYKGFLCRHAMLVLHTLGISSIPPKYVVKHWTNNANIRGTSDVISSDSSCSLQRFNDLSRRAIKLGHAASFSQEAYDIAFEALQEALRHCVGMNNSARNPKFMCPSIIESTSMITQGYSYAVCENLENVLEQSSAKKYKKQ